MTQGTNTTESYSYDAVGNRLTSLAGSYTVNQSNELTASPTASYTYDYNGNTLTKTVGSNTTSYAWTKSGTKSGTEIGTEIGEIGDRRDVFHPVHWNALPACRAEAQRAKARFEYPDRTPRSSPPHSNCPVRIAP